MAEQRGYLNIRRNSRRAVNGHYVSAKYDKPCRITVSTIDGKTVADSVVNGGSVYVPAEGLYIVTVYSGNSRQSHKIIVK